MIVYCRFADEEAKTIVEHYLRCLKVGVRATARAIFDRLNQFFEEHGLDWTKCKSVITDGAAAMQGSTNGVIRKIKNVSPECVSNHCMMNREALVLKKLKQGINQHCDLAAVVDDAIKIVNFVRIHSKKHRMFSELCKDMDADAMRLLYHAEIRWLSREKVLKRVFQLRQELCVLLVQHKRPMAINFQDNFWLAKLSSLCSIFGRTNQLNLSLQGKGSDVFEAHSKIETFKQKLKLWQRKVSICDSSDVESSNNFMQTCKWEIETTNLESTLTSTVH